MWTITILLITGAAAVKAQETTSTSSDEVENVYNSPRIVGGQDVTDRSQYAYQVSLRYYGSHFCGASIVSAKYLLTAAHCCYINNALISASTLSAVVGDLYLTSSADSVSKTISSITVHEYYDADSITNDIALMQVAEEFAEWTSTIKPIALATASPESGTNCVVSGWGYTQESGRISDVLQTVTVPIVDKATCVLSYGESNIQEGMICAGYTGGGMDACQGDSGGPMVCDSALAGIVSWGYGCAREGYPGVYTDVSYYYSWIVEKTGGDLGENSTSSSGTSFVENTESSNGTVTPIPIKFILLLFSLLFSVLKELLQ